jgi:hypothetical protein
MADDEHTPSDRWFGTLAPDDERAIKALIEKYGYARMIAAVIRNFTPEHKQLGIKPRNISPADLGL